MADIYSWKDEVPKKKNFTWLGELRKTLVECEYRGEWIRYKMGHSHSEDSRLHVLIHAKNHGYVRDVKYDMQASENKARQNSEW